MAERPEAEQYWHLGKLQPEETKAQSSQQSCSSFSEATWKPSVAGEYEASVEPKPAKAVNCSDQNQASGLHVLHKLGTPDDMTHTWHTQPQIPSPVSSLSRVLGSGWPVQSLIQTASFIMQLHPKYTLHIVGSSPLSARRNEVRRPTGPLTSHFSTSAPCFF